jgi:hypothetical protein
VRTRVWIGIGVGVRVRVRVRIWTRIRVWTWLDSRLRSRPAIRGVGRVMTTVLYAGWGGGWGSVGVNE